MTGTRAAALLIPVALLALGACRTNWRGAGPPESAPPARQIAAGFGKIPLSFEANLGQFDPRVLYGARLPGGALFFTRDGLTMALVQASSGQVKAADRSGRISIRRPADRVVALRMVLGGATSEPEVEALETLPGIKNYLIGQNPEEWHTHVPLFARLAYRNVYPGIDLFFHGTDGRLEYDLDVSAGADPDQIRFRFEGADGLAVADNGDLVIRAGGIELRQLRPHVYDRTEGSRRELPVSYRIFDRNWVGFDLPRPQGEHHLLIDPVLAYSTYLGGSTSPIGDFGQSIAVDSSGSAYVLGIVASTDFPTTPGALLPTNPKTHPAGTSLAFVTKLSPTGSSLIYSTYLGGKDDQGGVLPGKVWVNDAGVAYAVGGSNAIDFPVTSGAAQSVGTGFAIALSPDGAQLIYATRLGGSDGLDGVSGLDVDQDGNAYLVGLAGSTDFPTTPNAFQPKYGGGRSDAFFAKLNADGTAFVYASYLGGTGDVTLSREEAYAVKVNPQGEAILCGQTDSSDFPAKGSAGEAFVTKVSSDGQRLIYSRFLGGSGTDAAIDLALDRLGNAFVVGVSNSPDFPVLYGFQGGNAGGYDAFISIFDPFGVLLYSSLLGGTGNELAYSVALDAHGHAHIAGLTSSSDLPVKDAVRGERDQSIGLDRAPGAGDGFLADFTVDGGLDFLSYLGGSGSEGEATNLPALSIALDSQGATYFVGGSASDDFPVTEHAFQPRNLAPAGVRNVVVGKIIPTPPPAAILSVDPSSGPSLGATLVHVRGSNLGDQCVVDFGGVTNGTQPEAGTTDLVTTAGPHAAGVVDVTLTCLGSPLSVLPRGFTFTDDAGIPDAGDADGGFLTKGCGCGSSGSGASGCGALVVALLASLARRRHPEGVPGR